MFRIPCCVAVVLLAAAVGTDPQAAPPPGVQLPPKEKFHLYLLMGQSNMAGRGRMTAADRVAVPRVLMLAKDNRWVPAAHPVHFDKPKVIGVGLSIDFARAMAKQDPSITVGLIPCAFGGSPLSRWIKGGDLYNGAIARAKEAMKRGTLKGALWHQGEADSTTPERAATYAQRLAGMIRDLRSELRAPHLPLVAGELGEFVVQDKQFPGAGQVNDALNALPKSVEHTACVSAKDLDHKGDGIHFSAEAMRELGRRYAEAMLRLGGR